MPAAQFYVRKTGSDSNGGSSTGAAAERTGTDGVLIGTTTFTAITGSFVAGDVDKLINITTKGRYRITAVGSGTSVTLSGSPTAGTSLTWNIGGAVLTVGALLAAAAGTIANGDSIWIGAGTYREIVLCTNTNTAEVTVNGDVDGAKTGDVGAVVITAYTTNDKTAPSNSVLMAVNGKDFLTFKRIWFQSGTVNNAIWGNPTDSVNIVWNDCAFSVGGQGTVGYGNAAASFGVALNWTFDSCLFLGGGLNASILFTLASGAGADYDANVQIQNCVFLGRAAPWISVSGSGAGAQKGGGVDVRNCLFYPAAQGLGVTTASVATSIPCTINNCVIYSGTTTAISANTAGQVTEDYNLIVGSLARANVTAGSRTITNGSYAPLFHFGQERIWGGLMRPFGEPTESSPLLGFGGDGTQTATDLRGTGHIRPAGGASALPAVGALERANTFTRNTATVRTGTNSISITGPGYQEFYVPVNPALTTISVYVRWNGLYGATNRFECLHVNSRLRIPNVVTAGLQTVPSLIATAATGVNAINSATVNATDTTGFPASGTFFMLGVKTVYTGVTATSFTGCGNHPATTGGEAITVLLSISDGLHPTLAGSPIPGSRSYGLSRFTLLNTSPTKPQFQIDANGEIGVVAETKTAVGTQNTWEQLTLTPFTPSAKGIVRIRVLSNDTYGAGQVFVDDFAIL